MVKLGAVLRKRTRTRSRIFRRNIDRSSTKSWMRLSPNMEPKRMAYGARVISRLVLMLSNTCVISRIHDTVIRSKIPSPPSATWIPAGVTLGVSIPVAGLRAARDPSRAVLLVVEVVANVIHKFDDLSESLRPILVVSSLRAEGSVA